MTEELVEAARKTFELTLPTQGGGVSMFTSAEQAGMAISLPEIPPGAQQVWDWFSELHEGRGSNGWGPMPLSFSEIAAWCSLTGRALRSWEVRALRAVDTVFLAVDSERRAT